MNMFKKNRFCPLRFRRRYRRGALNFPIFIIIMFHSIQDTEHEYCFPKKTKSSRENFRLTDFSLRLPLIVSRSGIL